MKPLLPPKRFQDPADPLYDQIRPKLWFKRLHARKERMNALKLAYSAWKVGGFNRDDSAKVYSLRPVDLGDYGRFLAGESSIAPEVRPLFQKALNNAYFDYFVVIRTTPPGDNYYSFSHFVRKHARLLKLCPNKVWRAWEIDPTFWPD